MNTVAIIILAAGNSSRMGKPKQFLEIGGKSLLQHAVDAAVHAALGPILVVTGAVDEQVRTHLAATPVRIIRNRDWEEGMASSIRIGVKAAIDAASTINGVLLMVADQPSADAGVLKKLWLTWVASGQPVAAAVYEGEAGTPAIFDASMFPELLQLKGETGAKKLIRSRTGQLAKLEFPEGIRDIDTPEDYERFLEEMK